MTNKDLGTASTGVGTYRPNRAVAHVGEDQSWRGALYMIARGRLPLSLHSLYLSSHTPWLVAATRSSEGAGAGMLGTIARGDSCADVRFRPCAASG